MIIYREEIRLTPVQERMVKSGWGSEAIKNSRVEKIIYLSDGLKISGFIAQPVFIEENKYPCIIWNRGGIGNDGAIDDFTARGLLGQIASWGYVVFASQYRGSKGSEGKDEFGGSDLNDVLNLIPLAKEISAANQNIWGIEGWSRGGMMTLLTLTKSDIFKAAVVSGAISNLDCDSFDSSLIRFLPEKNFNSLQESIKEKCYQRSVINFPEKISKHTALLILHGTNDEIVPAKNSLLLSLKLLELKRKFRLVLLDGSDHFLKGHKREVDELRRNWFKKFLV